MIKVGDIVELLPTNQRNRQLRSQENKHIWKASAWCYFKRCYFTNYR